MAMHSRAALYIGMRLLCSKTCLLCYAVILLKCPYYAQQSTYYAPSFLNSKNKGGAISTVHLTIVDCLGHSGESKLFIATVVTQLPFKTEPL